MKFSLYFFPGSADDPRRAYAALSRMASFADAAGFHALWVPERHFHAFGGLFPNPVVAAAWLASITTRVGLRAGSVLLPLHHSVRVAEDWAMVDNLSGGRVGIAAGTGWHAGDFVLNPSGFDRRREIAAASLATLRRLWRGEPVEMADGAGETRSVVIVPRPVQAELPLWITCTGARGTFLLAAAEGCGVLTYTVSQTLDDLAATLGAYRRAFRRGTGQTGPTATVLVHTYVGRDRADVEANALEPFHRYLRSSVSLFGNQLRPGDVAADALRPADVDSVVRHFGEKLRRSRTLVGTEEECAEVLDRLEAIGVDEVACLVDFGVEHGAALSGLERLRALVERRARISPRTGGARSAQPAV